MNPESSFTNKLNRRIDKIDSLLCIGLDPEQSKLPKGLSQFQFNQAIIDATHNLVCAYKPNPSFYEAKGAAGVEALKQTCDYLSTYHPEIPIIIDAKRGDIGNSNLGYASYVFDYLGADAVTVPPYMGGESLAVFLNHKNKGIFVLCRTSNPGAGEFQDLVIEGQPLYMHVARRVSSDWDKHGNCLLVIGATYPKELKAIREVVGPDMPFLIPGAGTQGGNIDAIMAAGLGSNRRGLIINSSRAILFADSGPDFASTARKIALGLKTEINSYRAT